MSAELEIIIGGDAEGAKKAVEGLEKSLNKVKAPAAGATYALTNLSRVIQDAPFGLIGIANNIEPLIGSFVALKKETGSVSGAFSALGSSLLGGGGLIFAVGLASAAMSLFGSGFFSAGKQAKDGAKEIKGANDIIRESSAGVQGEISKVQALASVIKDGNVAYEERKRALEQLKEINKTYFGDLTTEQTSFEKLTAAVNDYTKALVAKAVVAGFEQEISKLAVQLFESQQALKGTADDLTKYKKALDDVRDSQKKVGAPGGSITGIASDALATSVTNAETAFDGANKKYKEQAALTVDLAKKYSDLQKGIKDATIELLKFESLDPKKDKKGNDNNDESKFDVNAFLRRNLSEFNFGLDLLSRDFQKQFKESGEKSGEKFIEGFSGQFSAESLDTKRVESVVKRIQELIAMGFKMPQLDVAGNKNINLGYLDVLFPPDLVEKAQVKFNKWKEDLKVIQAGASQALTDVAASFGSAIGGGGSLGDALAAAGESLLRVIGDVLMQIGLRTVAISAAVEALNKAIAQLFTPQGAALGVAAGIGLIAVGAALKSIRLTKVPGFADGVTGFSGGLAMVGERGPELVRLPAGSDVIPNHRIGTSQSVFVTGRIRGRDIYLTNSEESSRFSRLF